MAVISLHLVSYCVRSERMMYHHRRRVAEIACVAYTIADSMSDSERKRLAMHIGTKKVRVVDVPEPRFVPAITPPIKAPDFTPAKVPVTVGVRRG